MEHTVIHDEKVNRFEVFESGQIAYLQYEEKDGVLDILHTMVPPQLEGMGIAADLTTAAARYAEINQLKIKPTCSFAKTYFIRHSQYGDLLVLRRKSSVLEIQCNYYTGLFLTHCLLWYPYFSHTVCES